MIESVISNFLNGDNEEVIRLHEEDLAEAKKLEPDNPLSYFYLSEALILEQNYQEAFQMMREGQKLSPDDSRIKLLVKKLPPMFNNIYPNPHLLKEQQEELNEYYWCTVIKTGVIKKLFKLPENARNYYAYLIYPYKFCPNCKANLIYKS